MTRSLQAELSYHGLVSGKCDLVILDVVLREQNVKVDSYYKTRAVQKTHCGE